MILSFFFINWKFPSENKKEKKGTTFPEEFVSRETNHPFPFTTSIFTCHTGVCIIHGTEAVHIDADCGSFHSYQSPNFPCASFHDLLLLLLSRIERETLSLSVSLSAVLSATFLIKRPPRTVSSTAPCPLARNIKIPGRRSRAGSIGITSSRRNRRAANLRRGGARCSGYSDCAQQNFPDTSP